MGSSETATKLNGIENIEFRWHLDLYKKKGHTIQKEWCIQILSLTALGTWAGSPHSMPHISPNMSYGSENGSPQQKDRR